MRLLANGTASRRLRRRRDIQQALASPTRPQAAIDQSGACAIARPRAGTSAITRQPLEIIWFWESPFAMAAKEYATRRVLNAFAADRHASRTPAPAYLGP